MDERDRNRADETELDDPLQLKGAKIRPSGSDVRASNDEESVRRRRERAGLGPDADDRRTDGMGDLSTDRKGATGIDMGAGGQDTTLRDETK